MWNVASLGGRRWGRNPACSFMFFPHINSRPWKWLRTLVRFLNLLLTPFERYKYLLPRPTASFFNVSTSVEESVTGFGQVSEGGSLSVYILLSAWPAPSTLPSSSQPLFSLNITAQKWSYSWKPSLTPISLDLVSAPITWSHRLQNLSCKVLITICHCATIDIILQWLSLFPTLEEARRK